LSQDEFENYSRICITNILSHYPIPSQMPKESPILIEKPLLGFAHGTAGIAWSLMNYLKINKDDQLFSWIVQALKYEREHFSDQFCNWPDYRKKASDFPEDSTHYMSAWCHGATGIGIARLDMANQGWQDNDLKQEIKHALETTEKSFDEVLNLCHGSMGKLDFLLAASEKNYFPKHSLYAHTMSVISHIHSNDKINYEKVGSIFVPGLFTGAAGIAYQCMRIAFPENVPSVLLLEVPQAKKIVSVRKKSLITEHI